MRLMLTAICCLLLGACVSFPDAPEITASPFLAQDTVQSIDGARLGLQSWQAERPKAIIIAVHGMNDYSKTFALPGAWWAQEANITTYAYDQRGFGRSPNFERWAGTDTMMADLRAVVMAVRTRHPNMPIYVLGHSMGAAVVMAAEAEASLGVDGFIFAAPGVWGGRAMPLPYRVSLNLAATFAPGKTLTGARAGRQASDNIDILREMYEDPLVIKKTRLDAVLGVTRIMGAGYSAADEVSGDILFLIGEKDEVIPLKVMEKTAGRLRGEVDIRRYGDGWHLLFRDLQREVVWRDVAEWVENHHWDRAQ